jgi:hypothetical protein
MPSLNPYAILGAILLVLALCAGSAYKGHSIGVNSQKVEDQAEFDRINLEIAQQKAIAAAALNNANSANAKRRADIDIINSKLGEKHAENIQLTDLNRALLDAYSLRWKPEDSGRGHSAGNSEADSGTTTSGTAATCELPATLAKSLAGILTDADRLRDDYELQYNERRAVECY